MSALTSQPAAAPSATMPTSPVLALVALLSALGRPAWWILALAGFLVRGGIVLFVVAIVSLPSPLALSNVFGPLVTPLYLGRLEPATAALIGGALAVLVAWLVGGSWFAAATEVVLVGDARAAARDEGLPVRAERSPARRLIGRAALAHVVALMPLALAIALGSIRILDAAYVELTNPSDASSVVLRVIARSSGPVAAIVIAWILGEIVGGLAVRRIVLADQSVGSAVVSAAMDVVRRPVGSLVLPLLMGAVLVLDLAAVLTVVSLVWAEVLDRLARPLTDPLATGLTLLTLGAAWSLALLVTGLINAWRSVSMTLETERVAAPQWAAGGTAGRSGEPLGVDGAGTFGASPDRRPGDWSAGDGSGSL